MTKKTRVIKAAGVAKRLLNRGHVVVSTCPQRDNPAASCFVFYIDPWLQQDVDDVMAKKTSDHAVLEARLAALGMTEKQYRQHIFSTCLQGGGFDGT